MEIKKSYEQGKVILDIEEIQLLSINNLKILFSLFLAIKY